MYAAMNKARTKYAISGPLRAAHFFGQICVETDRLQTVREYASGNAYDMSIDEPKATELGNTQPGDGPRFKGRGAIQLTGRGLYRAYGSYRDQNFTTEPNNLLIETVAYNACDASGYYWVAEKTRDRLRNPQGSQRTYRWILDGRIGINTRTDNQTFNSLQHGTQIDTDVLNVTLQINRAGLHIDERRLFFKAAYFYLSDELIPATGITNLRP
jgi:hydroxyethylthiazole kinase